MVGSGYSPDKKLIHGRRSRFGRASLVFQKAKERGPWTPIEAIVLARTIVVVSKVEPMEMVDKELLGTISNRLRRWTERRSAESEASDVFVGLRLAQQELLGLTKNLTRVRTSDQIEIADKEILEGISNRVGRWAVPPPELVF